MCRTVFNTSYGLLLSFARKRESRFSISWIPGRASYRQLARNDVGIVSTNSRESTLAPFAFSLDNPVRFHQKVRRYLEPQGPGGLEVDHQLELRRPFYREIRGLGSLEDLINVDCRTPVQISQIGSITHEATKLRKSLFIVDRR